MNQIFKSPSNCLVALNVLFFALVNSFSGSVFVGLEMYPYDNSKFRIWQLLTHLFMHADIAHLAFNMFALWTFGQVLERATGKSKFVVFYLLFGLGAAVVHLAYTEWHYQDLRTELLEYGMSDGDLQRVVIEGQDLSPFFTGVESQQLADLYQIYNSPAVGASGAVYGVLVAFALLFPSFKIALIFIPIPVAARYLVPVLLLFDLVAGITGTPLLGRNIAHFAHLGGALTGFLLIRYWQRKHR